MNPPCRLTRREFLPAAGLLLAGCATRWEGHPPATPIIDIHQHTNYAGRTDAELLTHQRNLGVTKTVLLPAGRLYGLDAGCGGNETVYNLARSYPDQFAFFANEVADLPEARAEVEKYLKLGAIGIGEQKFRVACDSPHIVALAELARDYGVPMLLHFEHGAYNTGLERFHRILEKFPSVNFIGHAQTWWGHIDKHHDPTVLYPRTPVTPGGLTDRLLRDYPNMYGDLSAGSGLNALLRDEDHARWFLQRHQDKLLYGSDCDDRVGTGAPCSGARALAAIRRLAPSKKVERKILYRNAARVLKLKLDGASLARA